MSKIYNRAPLPFQGQKRNQVVNLKEILKEFPGDGLYIDVFGGSGLLSQLIKQEKPNAKVIYNDFDNYSQRLKNIDDTNELLRQVYEVVAPYERGEKINPSDKEKVLNIILNFNGYKDYITLSSHILFSGHYAHSFDELKKQTFYRSKNTKRPIYNAEDYLKGVKVVQKCGFELLNEYKDKDCVLVLDPPYLQTMADCYNQSFKLRDFLKLTFLIKEPYIFFGSYRSDILEFLDFADKRLNLSFVRDYKIKSKKLTFSGVAKNMDDYIIYKVKK